FLLGKPGASGQQGRTSSTRYEICECRGVALALLRRRAPNDGPRMAAARRWLRGWMRTRATRPHRGRAVISRFFRRRLLSSGVVLLAIATRGQSWADEPRLADRESTAAEARKLNNEGVQLYRQGK